MMKVSIIVPVYNIADCLSYCVSSLVVQDYQDLEIILVDDGSKDASPQLCDELEISDTRIKVVHKLNGGLSSARNAGLDVATGEYVLFIDGDDYLANGTVSALVAISKKQKVDFVQFGYEEVFGYEGCKDIWPINAKTIDIEQSSMSIVKDRQEMYEQLYILGGVAASACTKFLRLDIAQELRFKEGIIHEDEQFTSRLLAKVDSVCYADNFCPYKYVMRENSIIHASFKAKKLYDLSAIYEERIDILERLGYRNLVNITASKYFEALVLLYGLAKKVRDKEACIFVHMTIKTLLSKYKLSLSFRYRIVARLYMLGIPGTDIYYGLRKLLGK